MEELKIIPENERQEMYVYKPEFKAQGKFPIQQIYAGDKAKASVQMKHEEGNEKEHQNPEEVTPKKTSKVTPKDSLEIPTNQPFKEDTNLESNTQNDEKGDTQREDFILNEGWVPLFRKSIKSQVFQNEGLWKVWTWCIMKASHTEQWVPIRTGKGLTEVHLLPGQFIFGRKTAAKELKMKPSTVMKRMLKLENMQNCNTQSNTHYSIVTLTNWGFYRELMKKVTVKVTPKEQPRNTYKKNKNDKNNIYGQNFLTFWKAYPHKIAKKKAYETWQKLEKAEDIENLLPILLDAIEKQNQAKEIKKTNGEFVSEWPNPATWLNGRRWEDEVEIKKRWDHATG